MGKHENMRSEEAPVTSGLSVLPGGGGVVEPNVLVGLLLESYI